MLKSVEANTVVVSDDMDKGIKAESSITLGISDNHKVQYWDAYAYNCCDLQDSTLTLTDYVGTILLPINATYI